MARPSKYETMAKMKQIVKMSFADVQVTGYRNPKVTSKLVESIENMKLRLIQFYGFQQLASTNKVSVKDISKQ